MPLESWDRRAGEWIAWARAPGHDSYWRFHRDDFLRLVPRPGRLTLEIGCGEGRVLRDLVRAGHQAVGVDLSRVLARAATTHPEAIGEIVVADAVSLPFPDAVADCVVAFMSLQDIEGFEQAVTELAGFSLRRASLSWQSPTRSIPLECSGQPQRSGTAPSLSMSPGSSAASSFEKLTATDIQ